MFIVHRSNSLTKNCILKRYDKDMDVNTYAFVRSNVVNACINSLNLQHSHFLILILMHCVESCEYGVTVLLVSMNNEHCFTVPSFAPFFSAQLFRIRNCVLCFTCCRIWSLPSFSLKNITQLSSGIAIIKRTDKLWYKILKHKDQNIR